MIIVYEFTNPIISSCSNESKSSYYLIGVIIKYVIYGKISNFFIIKKY